MSKADHYRATAERVLREAQTAKDGEAKSALLEIASRYDWLAEWAACNLEPKDRKPRNE